MATAHFVLQGKGGVGKSILSAYLIQALRENGKNVEAFDIDPSNQTLASFPELHVHNELSILDERTKCIDPSRFDLVSEAMINGGFPPDTHFIIDNGASSYITFVAYLVSNKIVEILKKPSPEENREPVKVFIHTIICGGPEFVDTMRGATQIVNSFKDVPIILWINRHTGELKAGNKNFEDTLFYSEYIEKNRCFLQVLDMPYGDTEVLSHDISAMLSAKKSFNDFFNVANVMQKRRMQFFYRDFVKLVGESEFIKD